MRFVIELIPRTKKNSQRIFRGNNGRIFIAPSKAYKDYEKEAGYFLQKPENPIDYPVNIRALFYMPTRRRVDLVNLQEALCDVLVVHRIIADDNYRIVARMDGSRVMYDKYNPRTEVEITEVRNE